MYAHSSQKGPKDYLAKFENFQRLKKIKPWAYFRVNTVNKLNLQICKY